jgi:hypothetical protein
MKKIANKYGRSRRANFVVELPLVLWVAFVLLLFPMISLVSMSYRAIIVFFATRDAAYQAAKARTYTQAVTVANTAVNNALQNNPGISVSSKSTKIVTKAISGGIPTYSSSTLTTVDTTSNLYFLQETVQATVNATFPVPLAPSSYPISFSYEVYAENPQGLIH